MHTTAKVSTIFNCSLERAFKTPMLCDVVKVHTGFGLMPKVTHCTEDEQWGKVGSSKKVFLEKSLVHKGGFGSIDHVVERIENNYWKIEIDNFQSWMLSFYKFEGEWQTTPIGKDQIQIDYTYKLHFSNALLLPLTWMFTILFWKAYMKHALENVRLLAMTNEPYKYE